MRKFRYIVALILPFALAAVAKAAPAPPDFQVVVIDPQHYDYKLTDSSPNPLSVAWHSCSGGPADVQSFEGCFSILNDTSHSITSLSLFMPGTSVSNPGQACPQFSNDAFANVPVCTNENGGFLLYFSGGNIPTSKGSGDKDDDDDDIVRGSIFTIAENGIVDPVHNLPTSATFNSPAPTPEPSSLMLLSTGLLTGGGVLVGDLRRRISGKTSK